MTVPEEHRARREADPREIGLGKTLQKELSSGKTGNEANVLRKNVLSETCPEKNSVLKFSSGSKITRRKISFRMSSVRKRTILENGEEQSSTLSGRASRPRNDEVGSECQQAIDLAFRHSQHTALIQKIEVFKSVQYTCVQPTPVPLFRLR